LSQRLTPILAHMTQIAGAVDASDDGAEYFLRRDGDRWSTRLRDPDVPGLVRVSHWDKDLQRQESHEQQSDHDPRTRPWFSAAAAITSNTTAAEPPTVWSSREGSRNRLRRA
jgi:hypothetical protein